MSQEIFFTLAEYKQNYERLKNEFVDAYVDNDEEEFISSQVEWYQRCLDNTILEFGIIADSIGWETKAIKSLEGIVGVVNKKIRNERGVIIKETAQNLNVSFKKIIDFLKEKSSEPINNGKQGITATQWALYHYILQKSKIKPAFNYKKKELEELSILYGKSAKNLEMKYNEINNSEGLEGYLQKDLLNVENLLLENYPSAISEFKKRTEHIF